MSERFFPDGMPAPMADAITLPWWEAAAEHRLVVQRCSECGHTRLPPAPVCPECRSAESDWKEISGLGEVYTYTLVHRPMAADQTLPFVIAVVALEDSGGLRMISNIVDVENEDVKIGMPVQVVWEDMSEETRHSEIPPGCKGDVTVKCKEWFIDADTHITEPGDVWTSRLPQKFQEAAPRMIRTDDGVDVWRFGKKERLIPVGATAVAGWPEPFPSIPRNIDECPPAAYDAKARLEYMDEIGAWAMALYPNIGGFGSETFLGLDDPELMLACVQAYNDWLIEWIAPDPRRFIPVMATPFWDVDAAVTEIYRCREMGHRAILFTSAPQEFGMPFIGDSHWNPIWSAAQDVDLPISLHIGSGDFQDQLMNPARFEAHGIGPTIVSGSMSILLANAIQLMDVVMSGILPRNPKLRLVSVESGIGWLPFVKESLDHGFTYSNVSAEKPEFTKRPSEYLREQVWACTFFEEFPAHHYLEEIGTDRVLFETDYPHPICLYGAGVREKIDAAFGNLSQEVREKVLFGNSAELYGVDAPDGPWRGADGAA